jgi:hypothetical protein
VTVPAPVRVVGWILGDLATALVGTKLLADGFGNAFRAHSRMEFLNELLVLTVPLSLLLGYVAYTLWPHESAKWTWVAGVIWAGARAFSFWHSSHLLRAMGASHSVFWEMSGKGCESSPYSESCQSFLTYTFPSIDVTCYALGAICAWRLRKYRLGWLRDLDPVPVDRAAERVLLRGPSQIPKFDRARHAAISCRLEWQIQYLR